MRILLPKFLKGKFVLPFVGRLGRSLEANEEVTIDFSKLERITPAGLVSLVSTITQWRSVHVVVHIHGIEECCIRGYLQRMDFFKIIGFEMNETFIRHSARGKFVPLRLIDHKVPEMGDQMAMCLAPGGDEYSHPMADLYDMVWYVLTEVANNVRQHSGGSGYAAAQVNRDEGLVRIAIADNGRGIKQSFVEAGLEWAESSSDAEAIQRAIEPRVSSRWSPSNEGVGLTLVSRLVQLTGGWLLVASGSGFVAVDRGGKKAAFDMPNKGSFGGTLVVLVFRQDKIADYGKLLQQAKIDSGLLNSGSTSGTFT